LRWKETEWTKERDAIGCDTLGPVGLIDKLGGNRSNGSINSQQHAPAAAAAVLSSAAAAAARQQECVQSSWFFNFFSTFLTVTVHSHSHSHVLLLRVFDLIMIHEPNLPKNHSTRDLAKIS
jgi:hypothetical protein